MSASVKAFICGCKSLEFDEFERQFIAAGRPWGLILFRRNIADPAQVARLVSTFREISGRADAPVLVDQEGGRVQRLGPPHWPAYPPAARFAALGEEGPEMAALCAGAMAHDLALLGINVNCLPVLDVRAPGAHDVIGDRAYSTEAATVARFGRVVADAMLRGGVLPIIKHIPGHGRASADSHHELPRISTSRADLEVVDFAPFRALRDLPVAMTAHVIYEAIDPARPATVSPIVIADIIRDFIGFDGLLMTDDLSMKALAGSFDERTRAAFDAGADMALHCNGDLSEAAQVAAASPYLEGRSAERADAALQLLAGPAEEFDPVDARRRIALVLAGQG